MSEYVAGSAARIFINPTLGCDSNCSYCYLGSQGMETGVRTSPPVSARYLFDEMVGKDFFQSGRSGTLVSIGCFSECWSYKNKRETIEFIRLALSLGNPVQFATKRQVSSEDLEGLVDGLSWYGQLSIFVSCSTISRWRTYEKGTAKPSDRFGEFQNLMLLGVAVYLYIKPVIEEVTRLDKSSFLEVIKETGCSVVVGSEFVSSGAGFELAPIPSDGLYQKDSCEKSALLEYFKSNGCSVFESSVDAVNHLRCYKYA